MNVQQFSRKSFTVEGVQVTSENMAEVAEWCKGSIYDDKRPENNTTDPRFIKVRVDNPLTERQTMAFVGDWVLFAGKGYKVYNDMAFRKSFDPKESNVFHGANSIEAPKTASSSSNPGGTHNVG